VASLAVSTLETAFFESITQEEQSMEFLSEIPYGNEDT
jgi:hypothetical protein